MYRVGIIINENEVSHSKYADTLGTLKSAMDVCNQNGTTGNSYHFMIFDKFNINKLFDSGENNIMTFDGIILATNAMSFNEKIHNVFCSNKENIENFINSNKGLFISSQKKMSNGRLSQETFRSTGFLPEIYDYYLFDRPEKYSADGEIRIATFTSILMYPDKITNEIIKSHCENNQFIVHKYRSLIIPKHSNSYETLLFDNTSAPISQKELGYLNGERKVLLSSRFNKRVVISTMALDWANHSELLFNILTFITQSKPRTIFVKKESERVKSSIIDSYIIRANIANIPYRVISEHEMDNCFKTSGDAFIFSPNWPSHEIETIYSTMLNNPHAYFSIYHICRTNLTSNKSYKLSKFCNYSSIDIMKDAVIQTLTGSYLSTSWNKSVWTYSYILRLLDFFDCDIPVIAKKVYKELTLHYTKTEDTTGKTELTGSYDNVFNATCKMLEVLNCFKDKYIKALSEDLPYNIDTVMTSADNWLLSKIKAGLVFDQDICYCLLYLAKYEKYDSLNTETKDRLTHLFKQLLTSILEEVLSMRIETRSSVDLCRIYQTLCMLNVYKAFKIDKTLTYLEKIESILKERQDIYGNWKNISETAEITAMLLETYEIRSTISHAMETVNTLINKGIEILYSQFNPRMNMWSEDLSTTAKAMYAIGVYDKIFNFAINDFFLDLKNNQEGKVEITEEMTSDRIGNFYQAIDALEKEKELLNKKIMGNEKSIVALTNKLRTAKKFSLLLFVTLMSLLFIVHLTFTILYINHHGVLVKILGDWQSYFIAGFISFVITAILTVAHNIFNKKIRT